MFIFLPRSRDEIFDGALSDITTPKSSGRKTEERIETDRTETERYTRKSRDRSSRLLFYSQSKYLLKLQQILQVQTICIDISRRPWKTKT